jgi:glycosyltransferase involved in cell wall biosynthesis
VKRRKRILLVDLGASMGGVEAYLEALARILQANADLYAICVLEELAERFERQGVRVVRLPLFARARILRFAVALAVLPWMILRYRIDAIQLNGFLESVLVIPARLLGCETVYTRHGPFETDLYTWYKQPFKSAPRLLSRWISGMSSRLVCVSESVGAILRPVFGERRVTVIPNWVPSQPEFKSRFKDSSAKLNLLYVGRLERYKGLYLLLEALRGVPAKLTVVGDGAYRSTLEELAVGMDVEFVGFKSDPTPYYETADIFVMPSNGPEGLPMVALEAMSHGLPCVFSDLAVHREITANGRAAMLFEVGNVADLRTKVLQLVESPSLREQFAESAYRQVQAKYHVDAARRAYLQLFEVGA